MSIGHAGGHVRNPFALVKRDQLDSAVGPFAERTDQDFSAISVLENVGREFGCHKSNPAAVGITEPLALRHLGCLSPCLGYLALVVHGESNHYLISNAR
jgi:hypothetical protein